MEYLDSAHAEWEDMWEELSSQTINNGDPLCIHQGLCWEYMGSTADHHNFRHSKHPKTRRIEHIYIERCRAAVGWA
ncbi:MAG: 4-diphosphocytidyl-2C-methyl-D-erythritol kinase [Cellvibrionaceae bacterium]